MKKTICAVILTVITTSSAFAYTQQDRHQLDDKVLEMKNAGYTCEQYHASKKTEENVFNSILGCKNSQGGTKLFAVRMENVAPNSRCGQMIIKSIEEL